MKSWAQCLGGCIFYCSEETVCSFFSFLFDIWENYKLGLCIRVWKQRFSFWLYFYLSKRVSLCSIYVFFVFFLLTFSYFIPFGVIKNRFTKLTSSILMKIVTVPVVLVDEFYFYMYHPIKAWLFEKIIFELVYLFHIVLKSLVSY